MRILVVEKKKRGTDYRSQSCNTREPKERHCQHNDRKTFQVYEADQEREKATVMVVFEPFD